VGGIDKLWASIDAGDQVRVFHNGCCVFNSKFDDRLHVLTATRRHGGMGGNGRFRQAPPGLVAGVRNIVPLTITGPRVAAR
jgi:hypothetical protein